MERLQKRALPTAAAITVHFLVVTTVVASFPAVMDVEFGGVVAAASSGAVAAALACRVLGTVL